MAKLVFDLSVPRDDVVKGNIAEADFAADLAKVILGTAPDAYQKPDQFFENTYPTRGLQNLLANVCRRLSNKGGEAAAIFRLDTQYGGGKTHGLIALVHAARGMQGVANVAEFVDPALLPTDVRIAAFDGENADPANGHDLGEGIRAYTPWGEIAYRLAGREGYERVRQSDIERVAPGADTIAFLFGDKPALILLDELPVYLRKIMHIPAARNQLSPFLTALFKAIESTPRTALVYTLALGKEARVIDAYSEEHQFVAARMAEAESISARKATLLNPTEDDETVRVLVRRLFRQVDRDGAEQVIEEYRKLWQAHHDKLPAEASRADTFDAFRASYPLHPDVLETLTDKTATLANFQRVRGMLRLLARTVADVWNRRPQDATAIHLHHIDPGNELIRQEFVTRLGQGAYAPAIRGDVSSIDTAHPSLAEQIDAQHYKGLYPYAVNVARTIFLHTIAFNEQLKGITPEHLRFSVMSPVLDISFIEDARRRFATDSAYMDDRPGVKLRFLAEANLNQIIRREEQDVDPEEVRSTLNDTIRQIFGGNVFNLSAFPSGAYDVPDEIGDGRPSLVVISYAAVTVGTAVDHVPELVRRIFKHKGSDESSLRAFRNNVVFIVADEGRVADMRAKVVRQLALRQLNKADRLRDLAEHQRDEVRKQHTQASAAVATAIQQCYRHIIFPSRVRLEGADVDLAHTAVEVHNASANPGAGQAQVVRALRDAKKLRLIEDEPDSPAYMRDNTPLKNGQITTRALREEYRRDPRLPILASDDLLERAIHRGIDEKLFVYRRDELLYGPGDPPATVKIDEQSFVFTMDYAREHAIWPRPEVKPDSTTGREEDGKAGKDDAGGKEGAPPPLPPPPPPQGAITHEGVLREALTVIWERARARRIERIALLRVRLFDGGDAFRLIALANLVQGARKTVSLECNYETSDNATFSCSFSGPLSEAGPLKEFLPAQLSAAAEKSADATIELAFDDGLSLIGDAAEKLTERLTRQPMGAAYVEAVAEVKVPA